jgi:hypothetical protein
MDRSGAASWRAAETSRLQDHSQSAMPLPRGDSSMTSAAVMSFLSQKALVTALMALEELPEVRRPGS